VREAAYALLVLVWALAFAAGCGTSPAPLPTTYDCSTACDRGRSLACDFAQPTRAGVSCEVVCDNASRVVPWSVVCISNAATCEQIDNCN